MLTSLETKALVNPKALRLLRMRTREVRILL
jgi:hypothetical protein